jgi:hypothetical protein
VIIDEQLIVDHLRCAARHLEACVAHQMGMLLDVPLDLRLLVKHLNGIVDTIGCGSLEKAGEVHENFAVTPHASWLGKRSKTSRERESFQVAGRKGGKSRSLPKLLAAIANGKNGGAQKGACATLRMLGLGVLFHGF